ncbi:MAG: hypothetical protein RQ826_11665 [Xanthomonadales bacterium]|nr:hypothetical protein [Xanthomonadales bacterium]
MSVTARSLSAFHRIGERSGVEVPGTAPRGLHPALFAGYSDLSRLRYDFPLVLTSDEHSWVTSLTDLSDELLREIAPEGGAGDELRRQVLSLEQEIRGLASQGRRGSLSSLWQAAQDTLLARSSERHRARLASNLEHARAHLRRDGDILDYDGAMPARLLTHAWRESQRLKARSLQARIERLARKLGDILRVDYMNSSAARAPGQLAASIGAADGKVFDFAAMAQILNSAPPAPALPAARRQRIERAIDVLCGQRFGAETVSRSATSTATSGTYDFEYSDCEAALAAFRERLPAMAELVKAISISELEIENRYAEETHDPWFARFNPEMLGPDDLALFPSYLVVMEKTADDVASRQELLSILQAGLPFKILARSADPLGDPGIASGQLSFGTRGQQLAAMAAALGPVFVMQAPGSSLYRLRDALLDGMTHEHPALFSVYSGTASGDGPQPAAAPYLLAAAAAESRTFPCFVHDPAAGSDLAARYRLDGNPEPQLEWTRHNLEYEGSQHDRHSLETAWTLADFVAADPRFTDRFACVADDGPHEELVSVDEFLKLDEKAAARKVPFVWLVDEKNRLYRAAIDHRLVDATRRCQQAWRRLQELGGIDNSHARQALVDASAKWQHEKEALLANAAAEPAGTPVGEPDKQVTDPAAATMPAPVAAAEPAAAPASDDPWIETVRCTTCNECTQLNDRMFAYDADKRAYIADADAGTYRELVEAAETCQVAIIHPGKPRNPDEPGLDALLERAAPFM